MARKQYIDLSNSIEAWRQKNNLTSDYIGDLDDLNLSPPYDQTIVRAINRLDDRVLSEGETRSLFTVVHTGPTDLSSLTYEPETGTFYYNTVDLQPFHIPPLDASKITSGQLSSNRIPPLDASKVASGVLDLDRIPTIPVTKLGLGSGGETIPKSLLDPDIMYLSEVQTVTGQKTFTSTLRLHANMVADTDRSRDIGQPSVRFDNMYAHRFVGTATQALYADLAEKYLADDNYDYGTIVSIGGEKEITISDDTNSHSIIGVVSQNPGFILNSDLEGGTLVALKGRVPVRVLGKVKKGDRLVLSSAPGHATSDNKAIEYVAISLEDGENIVEAYIK